MKLGSNIAYLDFTQHTDSCVCVGGGGGEGVHTDER